MGMDTEHTEHVLIRPDHISVLALSRGVPLCHDDIYLH